MNWTDSDLLRQLVSYPRLGLITDMDGTISYLVPRPEMAEVTPRSRELLAALHEYLTLVAVVSGRGVDDLRQRVGLPQLVYVGNHGLERWTGKRAEVAAEAQAYRPALEAALAEIGPLSVPGVVIEDKGASASVHYRLVEDGELYYRQASPIIQAICARHGLRYFEGRKIFEVRPPVEIDKGTTFARLVREHALDAAVFLGDDITDADALIVARRLRASGDCHSLAVGVDMPGTPDEVRDNSDVLVPGVPGVEAFLERLLAARKASVT